ncbi:cytochrome c oxidase subunit II [Haladaptatus halobius]|uniref:cytochrome c oxidase subunit II n=1 Tax=Haladaptatus halobius TaxID=2884875 RepID=UPI001D0BCB08|nr:cytochrome c oxidase subunit II [Haladaptatus halobius]
MAGYIRLFPLQGEADGLIPRGTRAEVFQQIFDVFLVLGVLVGVVVIGYMVYTAYKYRDGNGSREFTPPTLGELPSGSEGGQKLAYSFSLSAIIVISLVLWTYGTLLYVEGDPAAENPDALEVEVVGSQFSWTFVYPNGHESDTLRVPQGKEVKLTVTSTDVFHTFGVPELRVKTDAIPGQQTDTWFIGDETGTYEARCFELCGAGHSYMTAEVVVMEPSEYQAWYANTSNSTSNATTSGNTTTNDSTTTTNNSTTTTATTTP